MSTQVTTFNPAQLPAFAKQRAELSPLAKALIGRGDFGKRLSIKGGVFRLIAGGKEVTAIEERYLDTIIVAAAEKIGRTWYAKAFDPNSDTAVAPSCWSSDGNLPDKSVKNPPSPTCAACPKNEKGSGQGDTRACRYSQRVAVVLANDPEGDVLQLSLPAASLFGKEEGENRPLQAYARWLAAQNVSPEEVITRLKFDMKSESPKLFFKAMRWLTPEEHAIALKQGATEDAKAAITMTVSQVDGVKEAAEEEPAAPAPATKAQPVGPAADDDEAPPPAPAVGKVEAPPPAPKKTRTKAAAPVAEEAAAPEPAVRKTGAEATVVPERKGLAAAIAEWDDD